MLNYSYKYTYNYTIICICIYVSIPWFLYNHDFQIFGIIILHSLFFGIIRS